ncbi:zinc finger CW-type PWWP domain protein 1-like [Hydractinia symbiolongicarpus]|uniref:zinc finger CW-type PWWP domain protein 1-like n=1 Tax=Hydractinia symbiolongicarpus TaxID=13093 RepID=UPI00254F69C2|nr:zinc finger CW-type PWWP domain protein 1-like [Hydractinia symbiolongicarpus]
MEVNKKHCQGKKAEDFIWVQCDNPKCMKWRKLPKVVCNDLSSVTWFCHMNADEAHNSCDVKEEKMHVPRGRTVVFSELEVGSLVWAKFSGYPRWPGVISPDPCFGDRIHIIRYDDGTNDPKYYHIEFLGKPHTHAWVSARYVQIYSVSIGETEFTQNAMKRKAMKLSFQKSISEASQMLELTQDQRLEKCIYRCIKMADDISEQTCFKAQRRKHGKKSHGRLKNEILSTGDLREMCANKLFVNVNGVMYPVQMDQKQQAMSVVWPNRNDVVSPITQDTGMALEKQLSCKNGVGEKPVIKKKMKRRGRKGHGQMLQERKGYLNQVNDLTKSSPEKKNGMSKSEKTRIDVEINRNCAIIQNESTFMKLFNTFCLSKKNPTETVHISWYKKSVNLFEFFKKVQYMGGYKQSFAAL